jgi:UDP-N-acetylglucosamine 3-dehydrogenase
MSAALKAAVIGVGAMGRNHARVYRELDGVELVAVADPNAEAADWSAGMYGARAYTDYRHMLNVEKPDLVSIAAPTALHLEVAHALIERSVHALVEKPLAPTVKDGWEIIRMAREKGVKLGVGHIERFNPAVIELRRRIDIGGLGQLFQVQARRLGPFPARIRDVGVVIDLAPHDLDIMRYVVQDEVVRVYAETAHGINTDREDLLNGTLRFRNGVVGVINVNWMTPTKIRELTITGVQGMYLVDYLTQELYFYENSQAPTLWATMSVLRGVNEGNMTRLAIRRQEPLRAELEDFVDAVINDRAPLVSGEDSLQALALAEALVLSGKTYKPVEMEPLSG